MKLLGRAVIKADGKVMRSKDGAKINIGGPARTTQQDAVGFGYSEEIQPSKLECQCSYDKDTSLDEIRKWDNVTVSFECDTGQMYVINGGWVTDALELTAGKDSGFGLNIEGPPAEEVK